MGYTADPVSDPCKPFHWYFGYRNYVLAAVKFSPLGGLIEIGMLEEADAVVVWIKDNGPGIPADAMEHIFNRFYQADSSHKQEGDGLGLSLVDNILKLESGRIEAENCPSGGCKFTVYLKKSIRKLEGCSFGFFVNKI